MLLVVILAASYIPKMDLSSAYEGHGAWGYGPRVKIALTNRIAATPAGAR